ncbi:very-long-chain 3-oxoacyl-CoA reductase 1 [Cyclospora cayetanensis]|uniref:Very-long-chain 3-oxoacyl-CoA reductase 1 n=1 Tax=Cyclospora cayetanensis TaxID=88456 RepID=A0A6P6RRF2_9EIME|nr:very-long-chain 3-oxoacyl-CoA reductase 1 [Cyclospora cayetanensis]
MRKASLASPTSALSVALASFNPAFDVAAEAEGVAAGGSRGAASSKSLPTEEARRDAPETERHNLVSYGEWAVITGASDGIGKAMANQLVKKGFKKLLLIARNDQKLKDVTRELETAAPHALTVSRLVVDFATESSEEIYKKISGAVEGMKARKQGMIVCVGSSSSQLPSDPLYSAYAATKAASEAFCRSLQVGIWGL